MINKLPFGKYALSIAHPGHELRLQGVMARTRPFAFIMTDGSDMLKDSLLNDFQHYFNKFHKGNREAFYIFSIKDSRLKDEHILNAIEEGNIELFYILITTMGNQMIKRNIDHVIHDSVEGMDALNDICAIVTDYAIKYVKKKTGKKIQQYDYNVINVFNHNITKDCVQIKLSSREIEAKLNMHAGYNEYVFAELNKTLPVDLQLLNRLKNIEDGQKEITNMFSSINKRYFAEEYVRPFKNGASSIDYPAYLLKLAADIEKKMF